MILSNEKYGETVRRKKNLNSSYFVNFAFALTSQNEQSCIFKKNRNILRVIVWFLLGIY